MRQSQPVTFTSSPIARALRGTAPGLRPAMLLGALALAAPPAWPVDVPFAEHAISTAATGTTGIRTADLDGDGDLDVVAACLSGDKITWHENDGAEVPGFTQRTLSLATDVRVVDVADLDGDGDPDVLAALQGTATIAWYENDGAAVPSFTVRTISTTADSAVSVHGADVDGDGDVDVLSASFNDDKVAWYENDGSAVPAFTLRTISMTAYGATSVDAADVDGDGDLDVLSASLLDDKIAWYDNDGAAVPVFTLRTISTTVDGPEAVDAADVDGDGDLDVLSASFFDDKIAWYENDGAPVPAFTLRTISTTADGATSVDAADVDGDGDLDVLSASLHDDKIAWYDNDGAAVPGFTLRTISTTAIDPYAVAAADVDDDGELDVLSASRFDSKVAWYENLNCNPGTLQFRSAAMASSEAGGRRAVIVDRTGGRCGAVGVDYLTTGGTATRACTRTIATTSPAR